MYNYKLQSQQKKKVFTNSKTQTVNERKTDLVLFGQGGG